MLANPEKYKMRPSEIRYLRGSMGLPLASAGDLSGLGIGQATPSGYKPGVLGNYLSKELGLDPKTGRELPKGNPNVMSADGTFNRPGPVVQNQSLTTHLISPVVSTNSQTLISI